MSLLLQYLKPVSNNHSVGKVVATCFLPQQIIDFNLLLEDLNAQESFKKYKRKSKQSMSTMRLDIEKGVLDTQTDSDKPMGLIMESFDATGQVDYVMNIANNENKGLISFEARKYSRWEVFFSEFKKDLDIILKSYPYYVEAINLSYVDQFSWLLGDRPIPVKEIFNIKSELLNNKFLNSVNGAIVLISQDQDLNNEEKINISFNNKYKRININHQYTFSFKKYLTASQVIETDVLNVEFDKAHTSNKTMLENLLSEDVLRKIGIKK